MTQQRATTVSFSDDELRSMTRVSGQARIVQAICAGWRTPVGIAKAADVTVRTVQRTLNRYVDLGLIVRSVKNTRYGGISALRTRQPKVWKRLFFFDRACQQACEKTPMNSQAKRWTDRIVGKRVDNHRTIHRVREMFCGLISVSRSERIRPNGR